MPTPHAHARAASLRWLASMLLLSSWLCCAPLAAQALRVMTFNVRLPMATDGADDWPHRRALLAATIRAQAPDVIGTQELYREQGDAIVADVPGYAWFGAGRRGGDGDEHMGVFYRTDRLRVVESGDFWLSDTPDVPGSITWGNLYPRMATWALFERIADRRRFYVFDTHFPYRDEDEDARVRCARLLLQRIDALPSGLPVVLLGDFNTAPGGRTHRRLAQALQDAWLVAPRRIGPEGTFHAFSGTPQARIDWILVRGLAPVRVRTLTTSAHGRFPSDHFPVLADLRWIASPATTRGDASAR